MFITLERFIQEKYIKKFNLEKISKKKKKYTLSTKMILIQKNSLVSLQTILTKDLLKKLSKTEKTNFFYIV